jgi:hypothetical protein
MVCESMLSASQDGLLREMLLSKYRLQIFDYIYIRIHNFKYFLLRNQLGFFGGGPKLFPSLGWGPVSPCSTNLFSRALQQLKSIYGLGNALTSGKCLKSNKVFTTQCLALKIKDRT